jgi:diguanylate cyclase (GGDEF)-like protein/putative nucleotidyltransferase with HDIG domain
VVLAAKESEALGILQTSEAPSVAILDWMLPGMDGSDICKQIRAIPNGHYTYLIALSPPNEKQGLVEAHEAGFDDFLSKPVEMRELNACLMAGRRIIEVQEKLLLTCEAMKFEASHDALTGVWNRAGILELLHAQVARSQRSGASLALLVIDVDHFKTVNDTYGHLAGDQVLKHIVRLMTSSIRGYDWLGRYGGDEFLIMAPECSAEDAYSVAERLRKAVAGKSVVVDGRQISVTVSIGVATSQEVGAELSALLDAADAAAYIAKNKGRNRVEAHRGSTGDKRRDNRSVDLLETVPANGLSRIPVAMTKPQRQVSWAGVQLPPFPTVAARALQLVSKDSPLRQLADLISTDPAFSSEVLTLINSPLYSLRNPINSIQQAIALLGLERVRGLIVTVGIRAYLGSSLKNPALQGCWRHSLACAIIAEELAEFSRMDRGIAYTGGMMHDIGRVALAVTQPQQYAQFLDEAQDNSRTALRREREWFEADHCEAGRRLVHEWNLPDEFVDITSRHHVQEDSGAFDMLSLIRCACAMADSIGFAAVRLSTLRDYQELVSELPERARSYFAMDPKELGSRIDGKINSIAQC